MNINDKIYIAGHDGMVGTTLVDLLKQRGFNNLIFRSLADLDLRIQKDVENFFTKNKPDYVFLLAAKVGGIQANINKPAEFIYDNLMIQSNIIHNSYQHSVKKLLFVGSSCIYPRNSLQPMKEEYLLDGKLEPTNEAYAVAKIAGIKMCQSYQKQYNSNFISVMPSNIYGLNDNFNLKNSHVLSALIRRFHDAKINNLPKVIIWGTGKAKREFLFVEDFCRAVLFLMQNYNNPEIINVGSGNDISIKKLANLIKKIVDYNGKLEFDHSKPDGMPRKLLDINKINNLGWNTQVSLETGIEKTYKWFLENNA
ncbi:MAG: GDP-L-fucose synthase [Desulfobacula sp.]|nr:GDP-L-fucose synthase [Desulfobacula sp.]